MDKFKEQPITQDDAIVKRFIVPINEAEGENGTVTNHIVSVTTQSRRANKRTLRTYLTAMGVADKEHKYILKQMGFWGLALGSKP